MRVVYDNEEFLSGRVVATENAGSNSRRVRHEKPCVFVNVIELEVVIAGHNDCVGCASSAMWSMQKFSDGDSDLAIVILM